MKKILFFCNTSNDIVNFRKDLAIYLINHDYKVFIISSDEMRKKEIEDFGSTFIYLSFNNRSKNIIKTFLLKKRAKKIIAEINPDIVFTFQAKPNIIGCTVSKKLKVKSIFAMVEGVGDPFQAKDFVGKIIRLIFSFLYKNAFKNISKIFFLNNDDLNEFVRRKIVRKEQCVLLHSIGINTKSIDFCGQLPKEKKVIIISRLIKNKGIFDVCEVARNVRNVRKDISFNLYGVEQELKQSDIQQYIDNGDINYCNYDRSIIKRIEESRIILSCSYREGFPRIILESMCVGRPAVVSNVIGNKDAVIDGKTGFLIDAHNIRKFADKIIEIIDNDELIISMGKQARMICEQNYDSDIINQNIYNILIENE